ncbi:Leucine Rich Repeat family protein [Brugia malayi]|uniref:Leucine Rich Repeat family protein n=1 Tax=Brugia malayi TaxID=6279 RepID=A0A4E9FB44_BRUMA|nr:Leucine Rich Repeat family protein [Brugia malayi]VIO93344.1 Leucine Rich Repeat family protein [Brugia malayi]
MMDFRTEVCTFARPAAMFKTLRRLHGYNLENRGLNDLSETFQNFVTRARFFNIGRLRRTWSHSAVEFLKYRRLLPMLTSDEQAFNTAEFSDELTPGLSVSTSTQSKECDSPLQRSKNEDRKILVTNISRHVTANQLKSFFSKFGAISSCYIPSEERQHSLYATLPKKSRSSLTAYITFKNMEGAERAKNATADELRFYDQVMLISQLSLKKKGVVRNALQKTNVYSGPDDLSNNMVTVASRSTTLSTLADVASLFSHRLSLSVLPPKVLTLILSFLPPMDRIRLERVSKSFLESSIEAWKWNDALSFSSDSGFGHTFSPLNPLRNIHLKALLSRCGVHLKSLDLSGVVHLLDEQAFHIISSSCPNLEEVNLSGLGGHWQTVRTFGEPLTNLRSVIYRDMVGISDKTMWYLFKPLGMNICEVDLRGCRRFKGRCFRLFGNSLEKILLDGCCRLDKQSLEELCLNSPNITELRLSSCQLVSDDILSLISRSLTHLKSFALCGDFFPNLTSMGLMALLRLRCLCELSLDNNSLVSDEVLEEITNLPHLRFLSLAYAGSDVTITEKVIMRIGKLKELQTLDVSSLAAITDRSLSTIISGCLKLQIIRARCCTYLGDEGVCSLTTLKNLEHIDLSGCLLVTSNGIQALLDAFPTSEYSQKLTMITVVVGGTVCNVQSLRQSNSRVVVDISDYSVSCSSNTAEELFSISGRFLGTRNNSDESSSDDEFDALTTHRSFIIDALRDVEDDSPLETQESIDEWAEREALDLGLIAK